MTSGALTLSRLALSRDDDALQRFRSVLSAPERERAERFHFPEDRRRYEMSTGFLRVVLGSVVGRDPGALEFSTGPWGKPYLDGGPSFNLSHSRSWALVGVAPHGRVGVDVEDLRPLSDLDGLAASTLHPHELEEIRSLSLEDRQRCFFRAWTRKEALSKATGAGLNAPLQAIRVSMGPETSVTVDGEGEWSSVPWLVVSVSWTRMAEAAVAWDDPAGVIRWRDHA